MNLDVNHPFFTKRRAVKQTWTVPGGHHPDSNGRPRAYDLWIESSDDGGAIPTIFSEVTDLGSAQSGVKDKVGDLTWEAQSRGSDLFYQFHQ